MEIYKAPIDICTDAVFRVGGEAINSIETPQTHIESVVASIYDKNRRIVLRSAVWNFAVSYQAIAKTSEVVEGFAAIYKLPNDYIRFLGIESLGLTPSDSQSYKLFGGKIGLRYEGPDSITLAYIKDVIEVPIMDALFVEAFCLKLAHNLSYIVNGKNTTSDRLQAEYKDALTDAMMIDGQEQKPIRRERSKWLSARRRSSRGTNASAYRYFED